MSRSLKKKKIRGYKFQKESKVAFEFFHQSFFEYNIL